MAAPATDQDLAALVDRILGEDPIGVAGAARLVGRFRGGRPTHPSTVTRWITDGVPRPGGGALRLEAVRLNGRWVTSRPAVVRFIQAQQPKPAAAPAAPAAPASRPLTKRRRASEAAEAELKKAGC